MTKKKYILIKNEFEYSSEDDLDCMISINVDFLHIEEYYQRLDSIINKYDVDTVVTKKEFIYYAARLLWNNENIKRYFLIDTDDAILNEHNNVKAVRLMWDCLAEKNKESNDPIKVSGWKRSDTSTALLKY